MDIKYSQDDNGAYQTAKTYIEATPQTVFKYLSTTEGIQQWFPQLEVDERAVDGHIYFHLEGDNYETMHITEFAEDQRISYTWDVGEVKFQLEADNNSTILTLEEYLPYTFPHIILDFAGWQFQLDNVKHVIEQGEPIDQQNLDFENKKFEIAQHLNIEQ
ncbi:SRPBCC domain-containing protein [Staphylococcus arlettae]|uniref:SRPBCC domain-containing protein n=1 Tax=Staphylococcus arlettae TaxID=29378 RepID=UPI000DCD9E25|nr:SRPBCC domain-containing protein [Staphylococcus arlettae]RBA03742.1 hypothetical protein DOD23_0818 [Staphylococcus arlettae]RBA05323.1 hypothetical protein DOD22_0804 [Staphylococcus arlettae]RBA07721.1 hypothetical protein DOD24_0776 [Staphylococcus arlettae]